MDRHKLIELRKRIKAKKPAFIRQDACRHKKLGTRWKKPQGHHSKIRLKHKGKKKMPSPGYKSPAAVKGFIGELRPITINNPQEIAKINPKEEGALISGTAGMRNKLAIIKAAIEKKIKILNIKDPEALVKKVEEEMQKKKAAKDEKTRKKEEKKKAAVEKKAKEDAKKELQSAENKEEAKEEKKEGAAEPSPEKEGASLKEEAKEEKGAAPAEAEEAKEDAQEKKAEPKKKAAKKEAQK